MAEPLKDLINSSLIDRIVDLASEIDPDADLGPLRETKRSLDALELKDRINLVADGLAASLTGGASTQIETIVELSGTELSGLEAWPLASYIERHCAAIPAQALTAMESVTNAFSCEFAIRPFLAHHYDLTMARVLRWTQSDDEHLRRLASEGTRPRLPWGPSVPSISADPTVGLPILDLLRHDPSEYVRRSVANHLNDISKSDPNVVVDTTRRWADEPETDPGMVRHALRSLVKAGHPGALEVLGFTADFQIEVDHFAVSPSVVTLGDSIELTATITSVAPEDQRLVIDFLVHHILANGTTSSKVFKWTTLDLAAAATVTITKKRKIATASTRRYYPGVHLVELQVAGSVVAQTSFDLPIGSSTAENRTY